MQACPICHNSYDSPFCPVCGYDRSADAQRFPTFSPAPDGVKSVDARTRERDALVACPRCGGTAFSLEKGSGLARCRVCGEAHQAAPARKTITAISAGNAHTAVLYSDGTVRCVGKNNWGQCNTEAWKNIVAISAGYENTIGLRADGTAVAVGSNYSGKSMVHTLNGIHSLVAGKSGHALFLQKDGTAASLGDNGYGERDVLLWRDLTAVAAGAGFSLGLQQNGTVMAVGCNDNGRCNTQGWRHITAIATGSWHALGLRADGTAIATGTDAECKVQNWKDLIQLEGGAYFSAGLRADGTVCVASDRFTYHVAQAWTGITAIAAGREHLVGLCRDGTLLAVGNNEDGQCNVHTLMP